MKVKLPFCIILLMITSVAWADSKVLWRGNSQSCGEGYHSTPEAARKACGYTRKGWKMVKRGEFTYEMGWYNEDGSFYKWTGAYVLGKTQSCELKDIPGKGTNGTHSLSFKSASKAPNMVRRCINNCEVEDRRVKKEGAAAGAAYGGVVCWESPTTGEGGCTADYTRIQTGAVCIPKPESKDDTQYDDVTANPGDGNSNGTDGKGSNAGNENSGQNNPGKQPNQDGPGKDKDTGQGSGNAGSGNQSGGQGGTGADSPRDSGSADEVDDKNKDKDKNKPGKGKGKGGGGGGNHGDKDKDGGKDGKDKADGSPNGTDNGTGAGGDKDGKGSGISGGDCKTGKAPSCKGET